MKPPDHLLAKNRKDAVHFLVPQKVETPLFGSTTMQAVACGHALQATRWATHTTSQKHLITCEPCWRIANPPHNPYDLSPRP